MDILKIHVLSGGNIFYGLIETFGYSTTNKYAFKINSSGAGKCLLSQTLT